MSILNKARKALDAFVDCWKATEKEKGMPSSPVRLLQDKIDERYKIEIEAKTAKWGEVAPSLANAINKKNKNPYAEGRLEYIKDVLNTEFSDVGHIDLAWKFTPNGAENIYYCLYYPDKDLIGRRFTTVRIKGNTWLGFRHQDINLDGTLNQESIYDARESLENIPDISNVLYIPTFRLKDGRVDDILNYIFNLSESYRKTQVYIYGAFSGAKKDANTQQYAGICILKKLSNNESNAIAECREDIPAEVVANLYKRRKDVQIAECAEGLTELPNKKNVENLSHYSGDWQGLQFYSRSGTRFKKNYLREFHLHIKDSGLATMEYQTISGHKKSVPGFVRKGENDTDQLFGEFSTIEDRYTSRMFICLEKVENDLHGCYCGFSPTHSKPYGGAITFTSKKEVASLAIANNSASAEYLDKNKTLIWNLLHSHEEYIDLPEQSIPERTLARFKSGLDFIDISGKFHTFSIGRNGDAIISYPLTFENGICVTYDRPHIKMESTVRKMGADNDRIWLLFKNTDGKETLMSFYIPRGFATDGKNTTGMSFHSNKSGILQARTEILIRRDEKTEEKADGKTLANDDSVVVYKIGSPTFHTLLQSNPVLRTLLESDHSILQVENKADTQLTMLTSSQESSDMYLTFAARLFISGKQHWERKIEQALLSGGILLNDDLTENKLDELHKIFKMKPQMFETFSTKYRHLRGLLLEKKS